MNSTTKVKPCPDHGTQTPKRIIWGKTPKEWKKKIKEAIIEALGKQPYNTVNVAYSNVTDFKITINAYSIQLSEVINALNRIKWTPHVIDIDGKADGTFFVTIWV